MSQLGYLEKTVLVGKAVLLQQQSQCHMRQEGIERRALPLFFFLCCKVAADRVRLSGFADYVPHQYFRKRIQETSVARQLIHYGLIMKLINYALAPLICALDSRNTIRGLTERGKAR